MKSSTELGIQHRSNFSATHVANILAIGSGILFAISKYFVHPSDPYSNSPTPWEPRMHDFHVLVVPLFLFACGVIWRSHILLQWKRRNTQSRSKKNKISGLALLSVLFPMVLTGYLIQVSVDDFWRKGWVVIHLAASAAWTLSYVVHFFVSSRQRLRQSQRRSAIHGPTSNIGRCC